MKKRACGMGLDKYRDENVIFDMQIKQVVGSAITGMMLNTYYTHSPDAHL